MFLGVSCSSVTIYQFVDTPVQCVVISYCNPSINQSFLCSIFTKVSIGVALYGMFCTIIYQVIGLVEISSQTNPALNNIFFTWSNESVC